MSSIDIDMSRSPQEETLSFLVDLSKSEKYALYKYVLEHCYITDIDAAIKTLLEKSEYLIALDLAYVILKKK
jgi:hypothetical protein